MHRYKLRTLLICLAIGPPLIAGLYFYPVEFGFITVLAVVLGCGVAVGAMFGGIEGGVMAFILLLLLSLFLPAVNHMGPTPTGTARMTIFQFYPAIHSYKDKTGQLPPDLNALLKPPSTLPDGVDWGGPYLSYERLPLDPWGGKYHYQVLNGEFRVWSNGPDKRPNTEDDVTCK
jgi:general secretion pathway protein G